MKDGLHIDEFGTKCWYKDGELHREDGPATIYADGSQYWHKEGEIHRDYGPAVIWPDGIEYWYKYGKPYEPSAHELMTWKMKQKQKTNHD